VEDELPPGGGAFLATRSAYSDADEELVREMTDKMLRVGHGQRSDLVAQAALDTTLAIWRWCGVTQEQAITVMAAQAGSYLPHQN
jgi:hypothetical protein